MPQAQEKRIRASVGSVAASDVAARIRMYPAPGVGFSIAAGPDGALWFTMSDTDAIAGISTSGKLQTFTGRGIDQPEGIVAGPDGALWFTNQNGNSIGRITTDGQIQTFTDPELHNPYGITVGPDHAIWFTAADGIGRISTN